VKFSTYSLPCVVPGVDPGVQAVSSQTPPGGRLLLLSARPAVTFSGEERQCPLAGTKLYGLVTEAHACEQLSWKQAGRESNLRLFGLRANALSLNHTGQPR